MDVRTKPRTSSAARESQRGQILVVFTIALVAMVGMVGLVIDGGSAFAQRREEQNVADLASMAGATAYLNATGDYATKAAAAWAAARANAVDNGYTDGADGATVTITVTNLAGTGAPDINGARVAVGVGAPHRNYFSGVLGMPIWAVGVDATSITTGRPNAAIGAMPLIFNQAAFPGSVCNTEITPLCPPEVFNEPGTGNEDVPQDATQFNWTVFCTANGNPCNANTSDVGGLIDGNGSSIVVSLETDIGPLNAGAHAALFTALEDHTGDRFPVGIVDDEGGLVGFALFQLTGIEGTSEKVIRGYFVSPVNVANMSYLPGGGTSQIDTGVSVIKLVD